MREAELVLLLLGAAAGLVRATESPRPRGVGPEFSKFYKNLDSFICISNPSVHLTASQINDDYCDCPDGSDEPGTSACSYLSPLSPQTPSNIATQDINTTLALPGYYCKNKGHNPAYIPFTYVNDGICDYELCCDGSDEYEGVGGVKCTDRCAEMGREWKKHDEQRQKSLTNAMRKRKELVNDASRIRQEIEAQIKALAVQIEAGQSKVEALEKEKSEIELREKSRVVKVVGKAGGKASVLAGLAKTRMNELREALLRVRQERDDYRERLIELEQVLNTFKEEYNPNFNDEGVKRAVRSWDDYAAKPKWQEGDDAQERDLEEMTKDADGIAWEEFENEEQNSDDIDLLYQFEAYLPPTLRNWLDAKLRELRVLLIKNGILAASSTSTVTENKAVKDAQDRLSAATNDLAQEKRKLTSHEEDLAKDYGSDDVFRPLKGRCVSLDSGEYTYELCWMDRVTQKSKKGGGQNGMGNFARFDKVVVEEEVAPDGKGLGSGERVAMRYENGQHCWNGPSRSTTVVMACAENEEVWKVVEEEKCVYRMEVGTPAVCETGVPSGGKLPDKDEL